MEADTPSRARVCDGTCMAVYRVRRAMHTCHVWKIKVQKWRLTFLTCIQHMCVLLSESDGVKTDGSVFLAISRLLYCNMDTVKTASCGALCHAMQNLHARVYHLLFSSSVNTNFTSFHASYFFTRARPINRVHLWYKMPRHSRRRSIAQEYTPRSHGMAWTQHYGVTVVVV